MNGRFFKKNEMLIVIALLLAAVVALAVFRLRDPGAVAVVTYYGEVTQEIRLKEDGVYTIDADLPVTLEVADGKIRFLHSQCPDKLCEGFGWIGAQGEYAICLPARVTVVVREN